MAFVGERKPFKLSTFILKGSTQSILFYSILHVFHSILFSSSHHLTCGASETFSTFAGRTKPRTQKSWSRQTFLVSSPSCARPSWDGPRLPHARWPHSKAALLRGTLLWQAHSWRAAKALQGQSKSLPKRLQHQRWVPGVSCLRQTLLTPTHHQRRPRSRGTQVPSSRGEAGSTQGKSRQH